MVQIYVTSKVTYLKLSSQKYYCQELIMLF